VLAVSLAMLATAVIAGLVYVGYERLGAAGVGLAALRTLGVAALVLLLINPSGAARHTTAPPTILLDASLSMDAAGGRWREALDTARALAGRDGVILRFGTRVTPFDTLAPTDGATRLADALAIAQGRPGPVVVVTDGEIGDAPTVEPSLLAGARVVVLPRAAVSDAALLDLEAPERLARGDSLPVELSIGTFGPLRPGPADLVISLDGHPLERRSVTLPPAPGTARRRFAIPPGRLPAGTHLLGVRLAAPGDAEPRDDERQRWIHVAAQPDVVALAVPADWESRFFARETADIAQGAVRSFAMIRAGQWVDRRTLAPVEPVAVRRAARGASVLIRFGAGSGEPDRGQADWRWLPSDASGSAIAGDWYVSGAALASPLAGRLGGVDWDSLPPLLALVPVVPAAGDWVALSARLGRQGPQRPVLLGRDSAGVRRLTVAAAGLWRWALRGGAAREAYRSILAAGLEWLLGGEAGGQRAPLAASPAVSAGIPVTFRWSGGSVPDSLVVTLREAGRARTATLRFDAQREAAVPLPAGAYRWTASSAHAQGAFVVERYSDEYPPAAVTVATQPGRPPSAGLASYARQRPWLFALVVAALAGEWIWRHRRGLP
jgi:hypothetical protein